MQFVVEFREGKSAKTNHYPHAMLIQDNWDDYGYKSTFHVILNLTPDESINLGNIKIIQANKKGGYTDMPR